MESHIKGNIKTQHPNGTKFEYVPDYNLVRFLSGPIYVRIPNGMPEPGVWITYPDGVRIFRPNSYYEHIEPLKPSDKDIF